MSEKPARRAAPTARVVSDVEQQVSKFLPAAPTKAVDEPLVPLSVRVPSEVRKRLRMAALEQGRTVQDCLLESLQAWLKAQP
jgi:hypothetical protein